MGFVFILWKLAAYLGNKNAIKHVAETLMEEKSYNEAIGWYKKILSDEELKDIKREVDYQVNDKMRSHY